VLATADCGTPKKFLCDVRKKETNGMAMQQECMEIWGITASKYIIIYLNAIQFKAICYFYLDDLITLQTAGVTGASYPQNLKVLIVKQH
jgi:hypothetical protein